MQQTRVSSGGVINRISQQHNNDGDRVIIGISVGLGLGLGFALALGLGLGLRLRLGLGLGLGDLGNGHVGNGHVPKPDHAGDAYSIQNTVICVIKS